MPRKRRNKNNNVADPITAVLPKDIQVLGEQMSQLYTSSLLSKYDQEVRKKAVTVDFSVLEKMAESNPLINAIIQKRTQQIRPFCAPATEENDRGYKILPITGKGDPKRIMDITQFFLNTGFGEDIDREDDLVDFVQLVVRDVLVFDQNAIEMRRTRGGAVFDFWYIDGTSIYRLNRESKYFADGYRFAQKNDKGRVHAVFKPSSMVFDYMNKRGRIKYREYGYSPMEQMIELVTTFLFGMTYNKDQFIKERIPKGFLKVMGDVDSKSLDKLRNYWISEMTGYGAKFSVPIIPSGKDGIGIDWQSLGQSNRDMEYHKLLMFIVSLTCAVYSIDPAELGIKTDNSQALIGESGEPRIQHSKDTGLSSLLAYVETILNKILKLIDPNYYFKFVGIKDDDRHKKADLQKKHLETYKTIDELRVEEGDKPFNKPWSEVPLHPQLAQVMQVTQMAEEGGGEFNTEPVTTEAVGNEKPDFAGGEANRETPANKDDKDSKTDLGLFRKSIVEGNNLTIVIK